MQTGCLSGVSGAMGKRDERRVMRDESRARVGRMRLDGG